MNTPASSAEAAASSVMTILRRRARRAAALRASSAVAARSRRRAARSAALRGSGLTPGSGGAAGPIEIQGFVQNLFSGTLQGSATACTTNKDCAVVTPVPSNLPVIEIVGVEVGTNDFCSSRSLLGPTLR